MPRTASGVRRTGEAGAVAGQPLVVVTTAELPLNFTGNDLAALITALPPEATFEVRLRGKGLRDSAHLGYFFTASYRSAQPARHRTPAPRWMTFGEQQAEAALHPNEATKESSR